MPQTVHPYAKKSLGQHFLKNPDISRRIVEMLHIESGDQVLEIGPGPGALTHLICQRRPARLTLLEKDDHWAAVHAKTLREYSGASALHMDALQFSWPDLHGSWKIIGNLPYNIASPLIWDAVSTVPHLARAVFMVQKEVAERLAAPAGGRTYGALSVWVQSFAKVEWGFTVGPENFSPPPKVDSAVVSMTALPTSLRPAQPEAFAHIIKLCFQQRRKQLQAILRKHGIAEASALLETMGIAPTARPETLSCINFHELTTKCAPLLLTSVPKHD